MRWPPRIPICCIEQASLSPPPRRAATLHNPLHQPPCKAGFTLFFFFLSLWIINELRRNASQYSRKELIDTIVVGATRCGNNRVSCVLTWTLFKSLKLVAEHVVWQRCYTVHPNPWKMPIWVFSEHLEFDLLFGFKRTKCNVGVCNASKVLPSKMNSAI